MASAKPNILIIMADQLSPAFLPCYGGVVVKSPNIDRLAASGVVFESAYCNSPLCAPSRAAFMTGCLPSRTGVYDNAAEFRADIPTFAHYLRTAGYRTVLSGKMHFCGPDQLHGFEERLTTDIYPADFGWTPDWDQPGVRPTWYHNMSSVTDAGTCVRTNQLDFDDEVVFTSQRAIYDHVRSNDGRPLCLVASMTHPHDPFAIPKAYWDLYSDEDIPRPEPVAANRMDPHSERLRHVYDMDADPVSDAQVRAARRAYFGAISYVDANVGRILAALEETGLADDTVVIFTSDHGEMLGEHGLWYKMTFLEGSARVPLIIAAPGRFAPGRIGASVSLVDILPTLVDLAGENPSVQLQADGRSLLPHLAGGEGPDGVIGEYLAEGTLAPMIMLRWGPWKFIHAPGDPDQLFDMARDPGETTNLATQDECREVVAAFLGEIAKRWDLPALDRAVRESQRRRRVVAAALATGRASAWDFQPTVDASRQYMRNTIDLDELEARARFPRVVR